MGGVASVSAGAPAQAEPAPLEQNRAGRAQSPREQRVGLVARFLRALQKRLFGAGYEHARSTQAAWPRRHPLLCAWIVLVLFYFELLGFASWGGELAWLLMVGAAVWWVSAGRRGVLAATARDLAVLVLTGLTIVFVALCGLNEYFTSVRPSTVKSVEESLARFRLVFTGRLSISPALLLIAGTVALALAVTWANLDAAKHYKRAQRALGSSQTLLLVLCSLVIYAQSPLQRNVRVVHNQLTNAYRAALEQQWKAQSESAAAAPMRASRTP
jgi:hypothetical protein